ncbi:MAG: T9SS type A sorting domain-containing protein [Bacteroidetes bacterium]|nr:T9SS type A sorting domain-containing protein [Bacteroidota bacterium]MCH8245382.1 T9SS type A sorting domain-containing protein [Bacteroidota bacterium]
MQQTNLAPASGVHGVYDTLGRRVNTEFLSKSGPAVMDVSDLGPGVYFLRTGTTVGKIVIR